MYEILLFDLDNTLLDFDKCEDYGLKKLAQRFGIADEKTFRAEYDKVNGGLWLAIERGETDFDTLAESRFALTMEHFGVKVDGKEWNEIYTDYLADGCFPISGAVDLIKDLSRNHRVFIVTNGLIKVQKKRIRESGMLPYIEDVFVSQTFGVSKPDVRFFEIIAGKIQGFSKEKALLIGDSLSSDIKGGNSSGIATVWYNPRFLALKEGFKPDFVISSLEEVKAIADKQPAIADKSPIANK